MAHQGPPPVVEPGLSPLYSTIDYPRCWRSAPNLATQIIDRCASSLEAHGLLVRLSRALTKVAASQPLADSIPSLETSISERANTIEDWMGRPNTTIHRAVEELIKESSVGELSTKEGDASEAGMDQIPRGDAIDAAIRADAFKQVANALVAADTSTKLGRMDAIAAGFSGQCTLAVRTLCRPIKSAALTAKVPALARLNDLHPHIHSYLTWILVANPNTGEIPRHLQGYSIVGPLGADERPASEGHEFLTKLLSFDLASIDWVYSPGGLLSYKSFMDSGAQLRPGPLQAGKPPTGRPEDDVHPLDIYTRPEVVEELGMFIHRILTALGCAFNDQKDTAQQGVTFKQWNQTYIEHLKRVTKLPTIEERYEHLDHCHELYTKALSRAGSFLKGEIFSLLPATRSIDRGVLRTDEEPYTSLFERQSAHNRLMELRSEYAGFLVRSGDTMLQAGAFKTVLRSGNPALQAEAKKLDESRRLKSKRKREDNPPSKRSGESSGASGHTSSQSGQQSNSGPPAPGSQTAAWTWIHQDKELYISGYVWNVAELAKLARIPVSSKCWPWLLSTRQAANKPSLCDKWAKSGHTSPSDAAHILPSTLDLRRLGVDAKYCRLPTAAERAAQQAKSDKAGLGGRGKGQGKGAGRTPGKGARGGGQPSGARADPVA